MNAAEVDQLFATVSKALIDLAAAAEQVRSHMPPLNEKAPSPVNAASTIPKDRLAFSQSEAAKLIGISIRSLGREIQRGKITPTKTHRRLTMKELQRYLDEEVRLAKRKKRVPRSEYRPVFDPPPEPPASPSENQ